MTTWKAILTLLAWPGTFLGVLLMGSLAPPAGGPPNAKPLPAPLGSLAGTWQGSWTEVTPSTLVVQSIADRRARISYRWEDQPSGPLSHGASSPRARIEGGTLRWSYMGAHRFRLSEDSTRLLGTRMYGGKEARVVMTRDDSRPVAAGASGVPADLAPFLGTWRGTWEEPLPSHLQVHAGNATHAAVLYRGDDQPNYFYGEWTRANARFAEGKLEWKYAGKFTFQMSDDGQTLIGTRDCGGKIARTVMTRVAAGAPAALARALPAPARFAAHPAAPATASPGR